MSPAKDQVLDRRGPNRGDQRRRALLGALDELLREDTFAAINVRDIAQRAEVTRSAFYFYFENKAIAVAALCDEMYQEAFTAGTELLSAEGAPEDRIRRTMAGLFDAWTKHRHVFRAMLDARDADRTVRELWDQDRESFVPQVASMIEQERAAGHAPDGPDAALLATVLLELNDRALERLSRGSASVPAEALLDTLVTVWLRTIYGSCP
ncbi:TetR/AcrR family transcriptional regulator [Amycolatopsis magusensis]|uniref:TetR/AcrR family transcriptional regulator n=1 Tax=Amycolatopsis magusensis TaxID=882444 RepID=UPI0024A7E947|nr:TetR/AcrR family transcriptional regulator [Amycolatopsis magusensis]MDI5980017.1 TetR/AcrR family transcriptional regulator [Amycolatopsis magusensis]UJW30085.1 TetR/AcrR family transcriptional regulator [Saccharothrix sp. AJ9571]